MSELTVPDQSSTDQSRTDLSFEDRRGGEVRVEDPGPTYTGKLNVVDETRETDATTSRVGDTLR